MAGRRRGLWWASVLVLAWILIVQHVRLFPLDSFLPPKSSTTTTTTTNILSAAAGNNRSSTAATTRGKPQNDTTRRAAATFAKGEQRPNKTADLLAAATTEAQPPPATTQWKDDKVKDVKNSKQSAPAASAVPKREEKTLALIERCFRGGFRNQVMRFTAFVMHAVQHKFTNILLPSVNWGDKSTTDGSVGVVSFDTVFDVEHWNSFHPQLPRLVSYNAQQHFQWDRHKRQFDANKVSFDKNAPPDKRPTHPHAHGSMGRGAGRLWYEYDGYSYNLLMNPTKPRHEVDRLIFNALRPAPWLQHEVDALVATLSQNSTQTWMALHARVEADMHFMKFCPDKMVMDLARIFAMVKREKARWTQANATLLYVALNRFHLQGGEARHKDRKELASKNLKVLDTALEKGFALDDNEDENNETHTLQVMEGGILAALAATAAKSSAATTGSTSGTLVGSILDFFVVAQADIFIGTEISTFSVDVWTLRYFRNERAQNYKYLPTGVFSLSSLVDPRPHACKSYWNKVVWPKG